MEFNNPKRMSRRKMKRGAHTRSECVFLGAWIPVELMDEIDLFVRQEDLDRSKMIRRALEEKLRPTHKAA